MANSRSLIYFLLGPVGSGRREVLTDLIETGLDPAERPVRVAAHSETGAAESERWRLTEAGAVEFQPPADATHLFILFDGRADPVPGLQGWAGWLATHPEVELARIITVIPCALAERVPALQSWFDACVHFSDLVLLNRREGVANKWMSDFTGRYKSQFMPCLFEMVKEGKVKNPGLLLQPEARRLSLAFEPDEWSGLSLEGVEFGIEDGDEVTPVSKEELLAETGDEVPDLDPYFELDGSGQRMKKLPDITRYLGSAEV